MFSTWGLLLQSRKMWVGLLALLSIAGTLLLVTIGKIPAEAMVPTIAAVSGIGLSIIGSIAWEDTVRARSNASTNTAEAHTETVRELRAGIREVLDKMGAGPPPPDRSGPTLRGD
jgi:hypothetical protein